MSCYCPQTNSVATAVTTGMLRYYQCQRCGRCYGYYWPPGRGTAKRVVVVPSLGYLRVLIVIGLSSVSKGRYDLTLYLDLRFQVLIKATPAPNQTSATNRSQPQQGTVVLVPHTCDKYAQNTDTISLSDCLNLRVTLRADEPNQT